MREIVGTLRVARLGSVILAAFVISITYLQYFKRWIKQKGTPGIWAFGLLEKNHAKLYPGAMVRLRNRLLPL